ncbi:TPA: DUF4288 domain-containing protein [Bacillus cereus]|uniref:DUF4288 domain-containing protein n=1 Tax=Bacillus cereus group TaxID=86661 RepID=UPI0032FB1C45|nr:DUF4288 domain-containing protein [Bacillus cereus]MDA1769765.1 DUF4288 domain-containing protein [Bacillus cereus]HDR8112528.1 DUF4288 domain-containing protein [Bacillus cereus]
MYNLYSVKVLFESTTSPVFSPGKTFEERIFLVKTKTPHEIENIIYNNFPEDTYENAEGGVTTIKIVRILDVFELVENVEEKPIHLKEVYSRYLIFEEKISAEEVIAKYYLNY